MKLSEVSLMDIIPSNMRDDINIKGFARAFDYVKEQVLNKSRLCDLFNNLDLLTGDQLNEVAKAADIPWYDTSKSLDNRRQILANYMDVYHKAGTVDALEMALSNVFDSAQVIEWYEDGGDPFTFSVYVSGTISEDMVNAAVRTMSRIKPVEAVLDEITFIEGIDSTIIMGGAIRPYRYRAVWNAPEEEE